MNTRELTCICCPLGCSLTVTLETNADGNLEVTNITGNTCPRGAVYAKKEVTNPTRIVTSTVRVSNGTSPMVNVKTEADIPKDKIAACIDALRGVEIQAPVKIGDVVVADVAGTGVNVIAARNIMEK